VAVLAKSLPGLLPLFLAPLHALLAGNFYLSWKKSAGRWLYWSPLLLLPFLWWGYLAAQYGSVVFSAYLDDFLSVAAGQPVDMHRIYRFFEIYFYDFGRKYLPWIFFTVIGLKRLFDIALNPNKERRERAGAGLLLGWIVAVLIAGGLKPSQYQRYLMPALPAVAIHSRGGGAKIKRPDADMGAGTRCDPYGHIGSGHYARAIVSADYLWSRSFNGIHLSIRTSPGERNAFTSRPNSVTKTRRGLRSLGLTAARKRDH
jgi:hypothetical protein